MSSGLVEISREVIRISNKTIKSPYPVEDHLVDAEKVYVIAQTLCTDQYDNPDLQFPSKDRNIVAFDRQGNQKWMIETVPGADEEGHHQNFFFFGQCYFTRHTDGNVRFDPDTGEVLEILPKDKLQIGDERIEFSGEVYRVYQFEDGIFVSCRESTHDLYAFETNGTERWRSEAGERRGLLSIEDGKLWEQQAVGRTTDHRYQLDPETGERLSKEEIDTGLWG
jgi:outer membrane protein assembly factor BamB